MLPTKLSALLATLIVALTFPASKASARNRVSANSQATIEHAAVGPGGGCRDDSACRTDQVCEGGQCVGGVDARGERPIAPPTGDRGSGSKALLHV